MDDAKRYNHVLFLREKKEAADRIMEHGEKLKAKFGEYSKYMRIDNGKELINERIRKWAAVSHFSRVESKRTRRKESPKSR